MYTLFISDLHLHPAFPDVAELFEQFLATHHKKADALYILGDFFEAWIGDDDPDPFYTRIKRLLREFSLEVDTYFMHGNRDFLVGKHFAKETGITLIAQPYSIRIYDEKFLMLHGDDLCLEDTAHLAFRKKALNPFFQQQFLQMPFEQRYAFAEQLRLASKAHMQTISEEIMDVTPSEIVRLAEEHAADCFIHGHTHRPSIHYFKNSFANNKHTYHIVLSDWHEQGNFLQLFESGEKRLRYFSKITF